MILCRRNEAWVRPFDTVKFTEPKGSIVIAIICVLIAVVGLSVSGLDNQMKLTKCQRHLKSIHHVLTVYAAAYDGWFPEFNSYWGTYIRHTQQWGDGSQPWRTRR